MYNTRLMGDACFNNIVDKNISSFLCSLCHMCLHRNTVIGLTSFDHVIDVMPDDARMLYFVAS